MNKHFTFYFILGCVILAVAVFIPSPDLSNLEACFDDVKVRYLCGMNQKLLEECRNDAGADCSEFEEGVSGCTEFGGDPSECTQTDYGLIFVFLSALSFFISVLFGLDDFIAYFWPENKKKKN